MSQPQNVSRALHDIKRLEPLDAPNEGLTIRCTQISGQAYVKERGDYLN
jgi:hypothetical protein